MNFSIQAKRNLIGLALGAAVAIFLGYQFTRAALQEQGKDVTDRQATMRAMALADLVAAEVQTEMEGRESALPGLVKYWEEQFPEVSEIRVLRLKGARLLASTVPADLEGKPLPRRLAREDKAFFDLGQELRAGRDTNVAENVFRKQEIDLTRSESGDVIVTAPYLIDEKITGVVRLTFKPDGNGKTADVAVSLWLYWLGACITFAVLAIFLGRLKLPAWSYVAVAGLLGMTVLWTYATNCLESVNSGRSEIERGLAQWNTATREAAREAAGQLGIAYSLPNANLWDADEYRRPRGFFDERETLIHEAISGDLAASAKRLSNALRGNILAACLLIAFFGMGWASRLWATIKEHRSAYAYVTPAMLGMLVLVFFPFLYGLALAFTGQTLYNTDKSLLDIWVGLDNFIAIMGDFNVFSHTETGWVINYENFYWTAFITIMWTVCNVAIGVSVGLALALALNTPKMMFKPFYRAILILPWALPTYVTSLIWKGLFHKQFGPINQVIQIFGGEPISWFDSVFSSFITGITVNGWLSFPFMMLICLGGLQSISSDMYEAARLDGASKFQQFRYITLPSLKPTLIPAVIISIIWTFNLFNVIYLVSGGEPGGANEILVTKAYKLAFEKYQYGYAAAYSCVIFVMLLGYGVFQNKMSKATEDIHS